MSTAPVYPQVIGGLGAPELLIVAVILVLLFGAKKLPELARGAGSAIRIFRTETRDATRPNEDRDAPLPDDDGAR